LTTHEPRSKGDLIFVLAGRENRKAHGLRLYREGWAPRLLLSVGRFEIRRFARQDLPQLVDLVKQAANIDPPKRHFFVCFSKEGVAVERTPVGTWGTLSEIRAVSQWLDRDKRISKLIIVSSWFHLPRVKLCCRELLAAGLTCEFLSARERSTDRAVGRGPVTNRIWAVLGEIAKIPVYQLFFLCRRVENLRRHGT
jgi:hypothetical protein